MENFEKLEKSIGYTFKNKDLLKKALTHRSYAYENRIEVSIFPISFHIESCT